MMETVHAEEAEKVTRLHEATRRGNVANLVRLLDEDPLLLDKIMADYCNFETPLHVASMLGHTDFAKEILIRKKEFARELDIRGRSPLHLASATGRVEMVKMFLLNAEPGTICGLVDEFGRTPLHVASMKGRDEVVKELIHANPELAQVKTHGGETILHLAVKSNRLDTLKLVTSLLHVDQVVSLLNSKDVDGNTILHLAVLQKQVQTVKYLVEGGIVGMEINPCNNNDCTPSDLLLQSQPDWRDKEIGEILRDGRPVNARDVPSHILMTMTSNMKVRSRANNHTMSDDWVNNMRGVLMVVASLIATVAFQSGLNPTGGFLQEDQTFSSQHVNSTANLIGRSVMALKDPSTYRKYYTTNTISFLCSLGIILLLISGFPLRKRLFMWVLMTIMWVAIFSFALTYMVATEYLMSFYTHNYVVPGSAPVSAPLLDEMGRGEFVEYNNGNLGVHTVTPGSFVGVMGSLLATVALGNVLRLIVWLVQKFIRAKHQRGASTSTIQNGNV